MSKTTEMNKSTVGCRKPNPVVRPYHNDGYVNLLNKYGTSHDNSEAYRYEREPLVPDMQLTSLYEGNGLFSKIIDTPAEEALKHGYELNLNNDELDVFVEDALDELEWEDKAATAIKWARLYGGAIIVMLINDGHGLEEPVDWKHIKSIDELRVFERAVVQPDYASLYMQDYGGRGKAHRTSRFGEPEFYYVNSMYGSFKVHESRCLVFKNGVLPEQISNSTYQMWGMPEYIRIKRALRETTTAHSDSVRLLERSVQAIYKMKNLSQLLATDDGEEQVLRRLDIIDMAKGILNSIAIDSEGEDYDFKTFQFSGVKDVIDSTCNMLSALTNIPQTILFGRSPSGMNATGESDLENYYNYVERIQKLMLKKNLRYLLDIIFRAGVVSKELDEEPDYKLEFKPLWSLSESEQASIEQQRAAMALAKAQTTQLYVDMGALDPTEVRKKLASDEEYTVEDIIEEDDEDIYKSLFGATEGQIESEAEAIEKNAEQEAAAIAPALNTPPQPESTPAAPQDDDDERGDGEPTCVGVLVIKDGRVLTGVRKSDFHPFEICGPGGHIEPGETPEQAAIRETQEEFGITPTELTPITVRTGLAKEFGVPAYFICTDYEGEVRCYDKSEIVAPQWSDLGAILQAVEAQNDNLFPPFADSFRVLNDVLSAESEKISDKGLPNPEKDPIISMEDGGPGSGRYPKGSGKGGEGSSSGKGGGGKKTSAPRRKSKSSFAKAKFERKGSTIEATSDVKVKMGKGIAILKAGTTITDVTDFAGKGQKRGIDVEKNLVAQHPGTSAGEWVKSKGTAKVVLSGGQEKEAELHWFEHPDAGQVSIKVKHLKGGKGK